MGGGISQLVHKDIMMEFVVFAKNVHAYNTVKKEQGVENTFTHTQLWDERAIMYAKTLS